MMVVVATMGDHNAFKRYDGENKGHLLTFCDPHLNNLF